MVSLAEGGLASRLEREPLALAYRPVADLEAAEVVGYEVLIGSARELDDPRDTPAGWSRQGHAAQAGRVEARLVRAALTARGEVPGEAFLLVKVSTRALLGSELPEAFDAAGDLRRVVVALSDDADPADTAAVGKSVDRLRTAGARFAVDDTGTGYASLEQLVRLRPDLVRVGETFTAEVDRDPARSAVIEALVAVASRIDAQVICAEVPGVPELHALMRVGVPLAQGPVLGEAPDLEMGGLRCEANAAIVSGRISRPGRRTVNHAIERLEPLEDGMSTGDIADRFLADPRHDTLVSIDLERRPVALLDRAALLRGEPYETTPMTVEPNAPLSEVARRATSRPSDERLRPLVVCDPHGRYVGIVRIERLLEALASRGPEDRRG